MTKVKSVVLYCDGGVELEDTRCFESFGEQGTISHAWKAREKAAEEGWSHDGARDYCPEHTE